MVASVFLHGSFGFTLSVIAVIEFNGESLGGELIYLLSPSSTLGGDKEAVSFYFPKDLPLRWQLHSILDKCVRRSMDDYWVSSEVARERHAAHVQTRRVSSSSRRWDGEVVNGSPDGIPEAIETHIDLGCWCWFWDDSITRKVFFLYWISPVFKHDLYVFYNLNLLTLL